MPKSSDTVNKKHLWCLFDWPLSHMPLHGRHNSSTTSKYTISKRICSHHFLRLFLVYLSFLVYRLLVYRLVQPCIWQQCYITWKLMQYKNDLCWYMSDWMQESHDCTTINYIWTLLRLQYFAEERGYIFDYRLGGILVALLKSCISCTTEFIQTNIDDFGNGMIWDYIPACHSWEHLSFWLFVL